MDEEREAVARDLVRTLGLGIVEVEALLQSAERYGGHPIADAVATVVHDEFIDTTWPACPEHPNHPFRYRQIDGVPFWVCPRDASIRCAVGQLSR